MKSSSLCFTCSLPVCAPRCMNISAGLFLWLCKAILTQHAPYQPGVQHPPLYSHSCFKHWAAVSQLHLIKNAAHRNLQLAVTQQSQNICFYENSVFTTERVITMQSASLRSFSDKGESQKEIANESLVIKNTKGRRLLGSWKSTSRRFVCVYKSFVRFFKYYFCLNTLSKKLWKRLSSSIKM